jgi:outer membrane protein
MKKITLILILVFGISNSWAQKFAYVDSQFILENIPEYLQAKKELDNISYDWQEEIETAYQNIERLYRAYQTDKVLLTEKMRQAREDEIIENEKEVKNLQQQRFGTDGDLYKKQEELIRPIQNQIYNAIQEFAENGKYGVIFDKSGDMLMLYSSKNLDKSEKILDLLGY